MVTILAFITMVIDHIGYIFDPKIGYILGTTDSLFRIIGRIAFPLFAWGIVRGYKLTKNKKSYFKRIFLLGIISQIPFIFITGVEYYNICFTLLFGLFAIAIIESDFSLYLNNSLNINKLFSLFKINNNLVNNKFSLFKANNNLNINKNIKSVFINIFKFILIFILNYIAILYNFDYGAYGIFTIILLYIFWEKKYILILFFSILTFLFYNINYTNLNLHIDYNFLHLINQKVSLKNKDIFKFHIQIYSILSLVILYFTSIKKYDFKINFYIKYGFYPFHLAVLYLISYIINI